MEIPKAVHAVLPSIDALEPALAESGWELDFRQLDSGLEPAEVKLFATRSTALMRVDFANRVHQRACPPEGFVTFGVPTRLQAPGRLGKRPLGSETITCFEHAGGLDAVTPPGFQAYTLSLSRKRLQDSLLARGCEVDVASMHGLQKAPDSVRLGILRGEVSRFMAASLNEALGRVQRGHLGREMDDALVTLVLDTWQGGDEIPEEPVGRRQQSLQRALAYIEAHPRNVITVESLCRESACSLSTLERAFRRQFGVSPKRYLVSYRLQQVRSALVQAANVRRGITEIAGDFGFWHMSKFAADYRRMFGELPSATRTGTRVAA